MTHPLSSKAMPDRMTIAEMREFMECLHSGLLQPDMTYPGTAAVAMPRSDLARVGLITAFFQKIEPHADDIRKVVASGMKGR